MPAYRPNVCFRRVSAGNVVVRTAKHKKIATHLPQCQSTLTKQAPPLHNDCQCWQPTRAGRRRRQVQMLAVCVRGRAGHRSDTDTNKYQHEVQNGDLEQGNEDDSFGQRSSQSHLRRLKPNWREINKYNGYQTHRGRYTTTMGILR